MYTTEQTAHIACSFISVFYQRFTGDMKSLLELYSAHACASFADVADIVPVSNHGAEEIKKHLEALEKTLGSRKVEITHADFVPASNNSISITCTGNLFTRLHKRTFLHTVVLAPTEYRENCLHIASSTLRITSHEAEVVPPNTLVVSPDLVIRTQQREDKQERHRPERAERHVKKAEAVEPHAVVVKAVAVAEAKVEEPAPADVSPVKDDHKRTKRREPRKPKGEKRAEQTEGAPAPAAVVAEQPVAADEPRQKRERRVREPKKIESETAATTSTAAPQADEAAKERKPRTATVRLYEVPEKAKLGDVKYYAEEFGDVSKVQWFGKTDALVTYADSRSATKLVRNSKRFRVNSKHVSCDYYFEQEHSE